MSKVPGNTQGKVGQRPRVHVQLPRSADHPTSASTASGGAHQGPPAPGRQAPHGPSPGPSLFQWFRFQHKHTAGVLAFHSRERHTPHTGASPEPPPFSAPAGISPPSPGRPAETGSTGLLPTMASSSLPGPCPRQSHPQSAPPDQAPAPATDTCPPARRHLSSVVPRAAEAEWPHQATLRS